MRRQLSPSRFHSIDSPKFLSIFRYEPLPNRNRCKEGEPVVAEKRLKQAGVSPHHSLEFNWLPLAFGRWKMQNSWRPRQSSEIRESSFQAICQTSAIRI